MKTPFSRRTAIKLVAAGSTFTGSSQPTAAQAPPAPAGADGKSVEQWHKTHDRVWLGAAFWANPMEDWRIVNGAAECQTSGGDRNIHLLTHQITNEGGKLLMSVLCQRVESNRQDGGAGFRIGIASEIGDHRANAFARGGINAGLIGGELVLGKQKRKIDAKIDNGVRFTLAGASSGKRYELKLTASDSAGKELGSVETAVPAKSVVGNVAVVSNFDSKINKGRGARYRFSEWTADGDAFTVSDDQKFGPILWSMYSLSDSRSDEGFVMKISALTGPLGDDDNKDVELHIQQNGEWNSLGLAELDTDAWTATFRVPNWNEKVATSYRLVYTEKHSDGTETDSEWTGTIRANPTRPLRLAALTCQNHYGFPYAPVADNIAALDADLVYFSGDQLYESHGGYGLIREPAEPAILNYLRKFYMFGWAFREAMRHSPTLCIPDDHDVFQGNIWGEGGAPMKNLDKGASSKGGYREPARMVNVVHITNAAHHPDYFDPTPVQQDISVYYGDMVYGNVSFAILGDRQFKSGPEHVETGSGRADHVRDKDFDTSVLDKPGLVLLGDRQERFLEQWAADWRGHEMKVLLSQTVFAGVATHHGGKNGYLKADLDSGGWPQTARNNAIRIIRKAKCLHINGDQHLPSLVQYGVDKQRDSNWSFCVPAISAGYPRWWRPDDMGTPHANRPQHGLDNTGEYLDGLGNKAYVYAVGNPLVGRDPNRYKKAHEKSSGFGLITIDTDRKTYHIEAFRFLVDANDPKPNDQFPGWPVTLHRDENAGMNRLS